MKKRKTCLAIVVAIFLGTNIVNADANLDNAVKALKVCTGTDLTTDVEPADSNGDGIVNLYDAIYSLRKSIEAGVETHGRYGDLGPPNDYWEKVNSADYSRLQRYEHFSSSFDWRDMGIVTPSKRQGDCGSCWAFATVGVFESKILKEKGVSYDLSEQQQVSCNYNMWGCDGGRMDAFELWYTVGPMQENCTEYCACDGSCSNIDHCPRLEYRVKEPFISINTNNIEEMKSALLDYGPAYFAFNVWSDFDPDYWHNAPFGGVYRQLNGYDTGYGHAVILIGWDDVKQAWLCKNSWGANDGPNNDGTFWISYSGHNNDLDFRMANIELAGPNQIPENVYATKGEYSDKIKIYWNGTANCYRVYRSTSKEPGTFQPIGSIWQTGTQYNDYDITPGQKYYYRVKAGDCFGNDPSVLSDYDIGYASVICNYNIDPTSQHFSSAGGDGTIEVTVPFGCRWESESRADWIQLISKPDGNGDGFVNYSINPNEEGGYREGIIWIAEKEFRVSQDPAVGIDPPENVTATDGIYADRITIDWSNSINAVEYRIFRNTINDTSTALSISTDTEAPYEDTEIIPGRIYWYWVLSVNASNIQSKPSKPDIGYAAADSVFIDVPINHWAYNEIISIYNSGITAGCESEPLKYCPDTNITRDQMAIFLWRIYCLGRFGEIRSNAPFERLFSDINESAFGAVFIEDIYRLGITAGCGNGEYCPKNKVTRDQMAIFLWRVYCLGKYGFIQPTAPFEGIFTDVNENRFGAGFIEEINRLGITSGCGNGKYCPKGYVNRAQMAVFLSRVLNKINE